MEGTIISRTRESVSSLYRRFRAGEFRRFIRFGIVGGSGVLVNEGFAFLGYELFFSNTSDGARFQLSILLGIAVSIFTNFVLNDVWTWGDRPKNGLVHWFHRLGLYYVFSSLAACVQMVVSNLLHNWILSLHYLVANMVGIAAAVLINYNVNNRWTFRDRISE